MAGHAIVTIISKTTSDIQENTRTCSDDFKVNTSTSEDNSTLDIYEKEFERVMQEQEKLEICRRNSETVNTNCDISRGYKQSVSPLTSEGKSFNPDCNMCELNPVQTPSQNRIYSERSRNRNSVSTQTSKDKSFIPIDCATCELNPTPTQCRINSERSLNRNSVSTLTSKGKFSIPIDGATCELNPVQTPTQCRITSERSLNGNNVSTLTSKGKSFIPIDRAKCELEPVQALAQGENKCEPSRTRSVVPATKGGDESFIQINLKKPPNQTTIKTHTRGLGNSKLTRVEGSRIDYPPELNPFSDDVETERVKSTNPFGDSDEEDNDPLPPKPRPRPRPRHSFSTVKGLEPRNRLPVPLPRTASKSMPTTPNQSPLQSVNNSPTGSAYNSIRRKKNRAPPPPNRPIPDSVQSPVIASPKTNSRPRKTRLAPPPPTKPDTSTPS